MSEDRKAAAEESFKRLSEAVVPAVWMDVNIKMMVLVGEVPPQWQICYVEFAKMMVNERQGSFLDWVFF